MKTASAAIRSQGDWHLFRGGAGHLPGAKQVGQPIICGKGPGRQSAAASKRAKSSVYSRVAWRCARRTCSIMPQTARMNDMSLEPVAKNPLRSSRLFLWLGILITMLGPALYAAQIIQGRRLMTPWYLPVSATIGLALVAWSIVKARTITRFVLLAIIALFTLGQWYYIGAESRLPEYAGIVAPGQPIPHFTTQRADGSAFRERDLVGTQNSAVVFFRGRW
jgi:hypothetical protein